MPITIVAIIGGLLAYLAISFTPTGKRRRRVPIYAGIAVFLGLMGTALMAPPSNFKLMLDNIERQKADKLKVADE
jgi:hypothetical protein